MPCVALLVSCKGKYLARNEGRYHVSVPHPASDATPCTVDHKTPLSAVLARDLQRCRALADHVQHDQNMFEMQVSYRQRRHDVGDVCEGRASRRALRKSQALHDQCRGIGCYSRHLSRGQVMNFMNKCTQDMLKSLASNDLLAPLQSSACAIHT